MTEIALYLWQLPQNFLGLAFLLWGWLSGGIVQRDGRDGIDYIFIDGMRGGISLGRYIIANPMYIWEPLILKHEWGHTRQSLMLGPLYLLAVGLPSLLWAAWWHPGCGRGYYDFYTERWANELGGVNL